MAEQGTWAGYKKWDEDRRLKYPTARHWIYKSFLGEFRVAEWCPMTGHAWVE